VRVIWTYLLEGKEETLGNTGIRAARHITTAGITQHRTPKQIKFPQKANGVGLIAEEIHQKESVRSTIIPQHPTSE